MSVKEIYENNNKTCFSIELLPPLKGNSIAKVFNVVEKLKEFDPKFINITSHHSESIFVEQPDGSHRKVTVRKRPGTVAIAAAIQNKFGIPSCASRHLQRLHKRGNRVCFARPQLPWRIQPFLLQR